MQHLLLNNFASWNCEVIFNFLNLAKLVKDETVLRVLFVHAIDLRFLDDSLTNFIAISDLKGIAVSSKHLFEKSRLDLQPLPVHQLHVDQLTLAFRILPAFDLPFLYNTYSDAPVTFHFWI